MMLEHYQLTKNLLVSCSPKSDGSVLMSLDEFGAMNLTYQWVGQILLKT